MAMSFMVILLKDVHMVFSVLPHILHGYFGRTVYYAPASSREDGFEIAFSLVSIPFSHSFAFLFYYFKHLPTLFICIFKIFGIFERGICSAVQAGFELTCSLGRPRTPGNPPSQPLGAGVTGMRHHARLTLLLFMASLRRKNI